MGRSATGISGFGRTVVYGRRRVPFPPARITARISDHVILSGGQRGMFLQPAHRPLEAVTQWRLRSPACRLRHPARVGQEALHLALLGTDPSLLLNHVEIVSDQRS